MPRLAAKPIIDVLVVVADVEDEPSYVPALEDAGFVLRVREAGHRMFRTPGRDVHVHVYASGDQAITDYLDLRDWLRVDESDRALYADVKRDLAQRTVVGHEPLRGGQVRRDPAGARQSEGVESVCCVVAPACARALNEQSCHAAPVPIDFHDPANRRTYSDREADVSWREAVGSPGRPGRRGTSSTSAAGEAPTSAPGTTSVRRRSPASTPARRSSTPPGRATGTCPACRSSWATRRHRASTPDARTSSSSAP